jgi:TorA maturation chaperone TorD
MQPQPEELLRRAALIRTLAQGFTYPASGHPGTMHREFTMLRQASADHGKSLCDDLIHAWRDVSDEVLAAEYVRLFAGNGPCSLHETAYGDGQRMNGRPIELADINGFYAAFGLELSAANPDLPDTLVTELEFYSLLLVKQAYALLRHWTEQRRVSENAIRLFLEQHLGRWVGAFTEGVRAHAAEQAYRELARTVNDVVAVECALIQVRPVLCMGGMPYDETQADVFTCPHTGTDATPVST